MDKRMKPVIIALIFWIATFVFIVGGYSGSFGFQGITGNAVNENGSPTPLGAQSAAILLLFFSNIVTLFFLVREMAK